MKNLSHLDHDATGRPDQPSQPPSQEPRKDPEALIRQDVAAVILDVTPRCMENWRHRGEGPKFVRISGRCIRYRRSDLYEWIEGHVKSSTSEA